MEKYRDHKHEQQVWKGASQNVKKKAIQRTQNFAMINGRAYDIETGEDITRLINVDPVISEKQKTSYQIKRELKQHQQDNGGYVFAFFNEMQSIGERFPSLTNSDLSRLMFIGTYISYNEGEPDHGFLTYDNGKKIDKKSLVDLLGLSRNKVNEFYKKLIDEDIISEQPQGIAINPTVFYRGENVEQFVGDQQYTRLFRQAARELYEKFNGRSIKKLGVIYSALPYINFRFNVICDEPRQVKDDNLRALRIKDLSERLGYEDSNHLVRIMKEIRHDNQPVFKFVGEGGQDRRSDYIIVNPNIIYAGNGSDLTAIKLLFK